MATRAQNLQTALDNIAARLAEITASPKPSYSIDGESVSWTEYFSALMAQQSALRTELAQASGPYAVISQGRV